MQGPGGFYAKFTSAGPSRAVWRQLRRFGVGGAGSGSGPWNRQTIGLTDYGSSSSHHTSLSRLPLTPLSLIALSVCSYAGHTTPNCAALWVDLPLRGMDSRLISILGRGVASRVVILPLTTLASPCPWLRTIKRQEGARSPGLSHALSPYLTSLISYHHIITAILYPALLYTPSGSITYNTYAYYIYTLPLETLWEHGTTYLSLHEGGRTSSNLYWNIQALLLLLLFLHLFFFLCHITLHDHTPG